MRIGIPRESKPGENLVAATVKTADQLEKLGYEVVVERGAGTAADQSDEAFEAAGFDVVDAEAVWSSDVVVKVNAPNDEEIGRLRSGATVISMLAPARNPQLVERLQAQGVTALAMDTVPRISRAQSMDVLSSMANVAGYRAVVEAAHEFGRMFTGQVTAAGKVPPARVFVVGAGVAGLAAIGAASSGTTTARYSPPIDATWSATSGRGSVARTIAPRLEAAPIAARPATPAPTTNTRAGGTLPAAVTWPVNIRPNSWAASTTAR